MHRQWDSDSGDDDSVDSSWSSSFCGDSVVEDIIPEFICRKHDSKSDDDDNDIFFSSSVDTDAAQTTADRSNNINEATIDLLALEDFSFFQRTIFNFQSKRWDHTKISWDAHVAQFEHEGLFANEYLMTRPTHQKCVRIVAPYLQ